MRLLEKQWPKLKCLNYAGYIGEKLSKIGC